MLKALIRKQLLELNSWFYQDKKTGKNRSKLGIVAYALLFLLTCGIVGAFFYIMCRTLCQPLVSAGRGWLYFAVMSRVALVMGVFGSVVNTYSSLYQAKDNDFLLSLPIPVSHILWVRLFGVLFWGFFYELLVFVPAVVVYFMTVSFSAAALIAQIILLFVLALFVLTLSCILGWVVAWISARLKNKSLITVLISLCFLGGYYFIYFRASSLLQSLLANSGEIGKTLRSAVYPLYLTGRAAEGSFLSLLAVAAMTAVLWGVVYLILSRSFLQIVTAGGGAGKPKEGKDGAARAKRSKAAKTAARQRNVGSALLGKELKRFFASATYMLNCALGSVMLLAGAVAVVIKGGWIRENLIAPFAIDAWGMVLVAASAISLIAAMNTITAPSVSLEGKNLWILQSLPVPARRALGAKILLHLLITEPPVLLSAACVAAVLQPGVVPAVFLFLLPALFVLLSACLGLAFNLKMPNLHWTNETAAVKQSLCVFLVLMIGWIAAVGIAAPYFFLESVVMRQWYPLLCAVVIGGLAGALLLWIRTRGARIFERL